jgi:hypothetical protein
MATLGTFTAGQVLTAAELNAIGTWTSFTPVWTNLTVGNGTVVAYYCEINDIVFVWGAITFGSTTSISGSVSINHPVGTRISGTDNPYNGVTQFVDAGTNVYVGHVIVFTTTANFRVMNVGGTYMTVSTLSATVPFTWTTSDQLNFTYWYHKA